MVSRWSCFRREQLRPFTWVPEQVAVKERHRSVVCAGLVVPLPVPLGSMVIDPRRWVFRLQRRCLHVRGRRFSVRHSGILDGGTDAYLRRFRCFS